MSRVFIRVEGKKYTVADILQEAVIDSYVYGSKFHTELLGYAVKINVQEQPIFSSLTPTIEFIDIKEESSFKKWLLSQKVYVGNKCIICLDLYTGGV